MQPTLTITVQLFPEEPDRDAVRVTCSEPGHIEGIDMDQVISQTKLELHRHGLTGANDAALAVYRYEALERWMDLETLEGDDYVGAAYARAMNLAHRDGWVRRRIERRAK
tara:strand:- start:506 stop:835 length:330 start_codon:yes stop_codon:yes gene_type:complete